jgi:hypothetical protein
VTEVGWDPADVATPVVTLLSSFDGGVTWGIEASDIANTGSYAWSVPEVATEQGRLAVVEIYERDETGVVPQSEFVASDPFSIATQTGVDGGGGAFLALRPSNPVIGSLTVSFSLESAAEAMLSVFDINGRLRVSRAVGHRGPGWHAMNLGDLPAGVYVVRLSQAGRRLSSRVAVIR